MTKVPDSLAGVAEVFNLLCVTSRDDRWVLYYLYGQQSVENTEKDLLVDIHSLQEVNGPLGFCQVVMDHFFEPCKHKIHTHKHTIWKCHPFFNFYFFFYKLIIIIGFMTAREEGVLMFLEAHLAHLFSSDSCH